MTNTVLSIDELFKCDRLLYAVMNENFELVGHEYSKEDEVHRLTVRFKDGILRHFVYTDPEDFVDRILPIIESHIYGHTNDDSPANVRTTAEIEKALEELIYG